MCIQIWGSGCSLRVMDKIVCLLVKFGIFIEKRLYVVFNVGFVNNFVNFVGGDVWFQGSSCDI